MYSHRFQIVVFLALISLSWIAMGCSSSPSALATPTTPPATAAIVDSLSPTQIVSVTPAVVNTGEPSPAPSDTPALLPTITTAARPANPTGSSPSATAAPVTTGSGITRVKIFMIATNDNGKTGTAVGCGDSAVGVEREIAPTGAPLGAALKELLSLHEQFYGQSGLYNSLYRANLQLSSVAIVNGRATIKLTGQLLLGGECDDPRAEAQITQTALQFSTVHAVDVFVNGVPLKTLLSGK